MRKAVVFAVVVALFPLLLVQPALAGSSTDAALALGAFAVFNQLVTGQTIFHGGLVHQPTVIYAPPPPVVYAPPPPVVYAPPPVVYAPPPVVYAPPPVVVYPGYSYAVPTYPQYYHRYYRHRHYEEEDDD